MAYWMSPELLVPERFGLVESHPTNESDCYALGMMIYGVLGGQAPFDRYSSITVVQKVLEGERPERPQGTQGVRFTDSIWGMLEHCWKHHPCDRIGAKAVLWYLEGNQPPLEPPTTVGGVETGVANDRSDAGSGDPQYVFFRFNLGSPLKLLPYVGSLIGLSDDPPQPRNPKGELG